MNLIKIGAIAFGVLSGISIGVGATMACNKVHEVEEERKNQYRMTDGWKLTTAEKVRLSWPYFIPGIGFMAVAEFCICKNISVSENIIRRLASNVKAGGEIAQATAEVTKTIAGPKKMDQINHDVYDRRVQKVVKEVEVPNTAVVYCATSWYGQTDDEFERSLYYASIQDHQQNVNRAISQAIRKYGEDPGAQDGMSIHDLFDHTSGKAISSDDRHIWPINQLPNWEPKYSGDKNGVPVYGLWLDVPPTGVRI